MKEMSIALLVVILVFAVTCNDAWAQATAQIGGTARDQSGAVLPGVEISVTQTGTGIRRDTITNEPGSYVLSNLPIGPYRLESSLPGFRTYVQTGLVLEVVAEHVAVQHQRKNHREGWGKRQRAPTEAK